MRGNYFRREGGPVCCLGARRKRSVSLLAIDEAASGEGAAFPALYENLKNHCKGLLPS
jgi:hypothetical protein